MKCTAAVIEEVTVIHNNGSFLCYIMTEFMNRKNMLKLPCICLFNIILSKCYTGLSTLYLYFTHIYSHTLLYLWSHPATSQP